MSKSVQADGVALTASDYSVPVAPADAASGRIGLLGIFGTGNFGNDGSLEAMVAFLRRTVPDEALLCICTGPEGVERDLGIESVPLYFKPADGKWGRFGSLVLKAAGRSVMWLHAIRQLRRLRVVAVPGMGALDDFGVSPFGWPMDLMTWLVLARLMGVKVVLASVGAGPIVHPCSRVFFKLAARAAHYRSYRDQISKDYMAGLGLDVSRDPVVADIAFRLAPPPALERDRSILTVGVGVMTYYGWHKGAERVAGTYDGYIDKMTRYVEWLLDQGHAVRLLIGDETDNLAAADILNGVRRSRPELADASVQFEKAHGLDDVMSQMRDIDVAVVTRFHNVVCALKMGKPTISIGYQDKNDALLAEMGLADYCQHIERLDLDRLKQQTERLIADRSALEQTIGAVYARFDAQLAGQENIMLTIAGRADAVR